MAKRTGLIILFICVVSVAAGAVSMGTRPDGGPSDRALVESWSAFETMIEARAKKMNEVDEPRYHRSARLDVISSDVVRSPSLERPIVGVLEIQAFFIENSKITKLIPGGTSTTHEKRVVLYRLNMIPKDGSWTLADGVATMVWSVDDETDHPGEKAKVDLEMSSAHFGMDLIEELLNDREEKLDSK